VEEEEEDELSRRPLGAHHPSVAFPRLRSARYRLRMPFSRMIACQTRPDQSKGRADGLTADGLTDRPLTDGLTGGLTG
jgi:hypothetical protein